MAKKKQDLEHLLRTGVHNNAVIADHAKQLNLQPINLKQVRTLPVSFDV